MDWLKPLAKKSVPYPARRWLRAQQQRLKQEEQDLYDRIIVRKLHFTNREGLLNFNFNLSPSGKKQGISALLRVKNEEEKIYHCLASIYEIFDEIVFVDNGSEDDTLEVVGKFKNETDEAGKIKIYFYPFRQARFGPEHGKTTEDSVHSFTYYSNWSLSKCSFNYVCKWDGDMVLRKDGREAFSRFLRQIQKGKKMCWVIYGQTLYRDLQHTYFLGKREINGEIRVFPNGLNPRFYKVSLYELLKSDPLLEEGKFDGVLFYELKFVNTDEFAHWSIRDIPTERKKRELENFQSIKTGDVSGAQFERLPPSFLDDQIG